MLFCTQLPSFPMCSGNTMEDGNPFFDARNTRTMLSAHGHKLGAFAVTLSAFRGM
jgi:hypothetical protein